MGGENSRKFPRCRVCKWLEGKAAEGHFVVICFLAFYVVVLNSYDLSIMYGFEGVSVNVNSREVF